MGHRLQADTPKSKGHPIAALNIPLAPAGAGQYELTGGQLLPSAPHADAALLLGGLIEASDPYTASHSRDVVELALLVADDLALAPAGRRRVELGALLHDVGKIRIPATILTKPGPLDDREWVLMRAHTIEGEAMLRACGGSIATVAGIVRHAHERHDGRGYPDGLAGEAIPVESRIISVCDAYNAMTTDRPYRAALDRDEALAELRRCAGSQFDPWMVGALVRVLALPPGEA